MIYELSFGKLIKHTESVVEVIITEWIEVDEDHANEINGLFKKIMTKPFGVLVNITNKYSFKFEGALNIGNSPLEKKAAILTHNKMSEIAMRTVKSTQKMNFPNKEIRFFNDREEALQWLNKI